MRFLSGRRTGANIGSLPSLEREARWTSVWRNLSKDVVHGIKLLNQFQLVSSFSSQQPQIILLKEGTDTSQGKGQLISNINACQGIVDAVRTTLGPRGMDKMVVEEKKVSRELCFLCAYRFR